MRRHLSAIAIAGVAVSGENPEVTSSDAVVSSRAASLLSSTGLSSTRACLRVATNILASGDKGSAAWTSDTGSGTISDSTSTGLLGSVTSAGIGSRTSFSAIRFNCFYRASSTGSSRVTAAKVFEVK
ncbi:hypothetical protein PF005_g14820 [Phytophthora fragariae]|uniref:Uncharacterized protein n=1 Tax=Phytophthora fragariae TaxID=53985 RepID=A0A6A3XFU6_9STRA|nr:hypothetical protein PF003_g5504 [Phytophthora fragariae]KAE8941297.1 hypothetical protein PF009_g8911 [Phytophthora fragariae]KAE9010137.1 hypothetical protein PF011_g9953 [Phytophthora fragariae]KAE9096560.1 hypothetical protein PF010_g16302 [Phytophthora fragariae]KAE9112145.1 hypothetical protein PF007_g11211 [Phytophthora fragariae]